MPDHTLDIRSRWAAARMLAFSSLLVLTTGCPEDDDSGSTTDGSTDGNVTATATATATAGATAGATVGGTANATVGGTANATVGGTANATAGGTGTAGTGDMTGGTGDMTGGTGGGAMFCQESCVADTDCTAQTLDLGMTCVNSRCAHACVENTDCVKFDSGWMQSPCTMGGGECAAGVQACVDLGNGAGGCAMMPSEQVPCTAPFAEVQVMDLDTGMPVTVCGNTMRSCMDGVCMAQVEVPKCTSDAECAGATPHCDVATGMCMCHTNEECVAGGGSSDVCYDGHCGCSSAAVCTTKAFDGTVSVCEAVPG